MLMLVHVVLQAVDEIFNNYDPSTILSVLSAHSTGQERRRLSDRVSQDPELLQLAANATTRTFPEVQMCFTKSYRWQTIFLIVASMLVNIQYYGCFYGFPMLWRQLHDCFSVRDFPRNGQRDYEEDRKLELQGATTYGGGTTAAAAYVEIGANKLSEKTAARRSSSAGFSSSMDLLPREPEASQQFVVSPLGDSTSLYEAAPGAGLLGFFRASRPSLLDEKNLLFSDWTGAWSSSASTGEHDTSHARRAATRGQHGQQSSFLDLQDSLLVGSLFRSPRERREGNGKKRRHRKSASLRHANDTVELDPSTTSQFLSADAPAFLQVNSARLMLKGGGFSQFINSPCGNLLLQEVVVIPGVVFYLWFLGVSKRRTQLYFWLVSFFVTSIIVLVAIQSAPCLLTGVLRKGDISDYSSSLGEHGGKEHQYGDVVYRDDLRYDEGRRGDEYVHHGEKRKTYDDHPVRGGRVVAWVPMVELSLRELHREVGKTWHGFVGGSSAGRLSWLTGIAGVAEKRRGSSAGAGRSTSSVTKNDGAASSQDIKNPQSTASGSSHASSMRRAGRSSPLRGSEKDPPPPPAPPTAFLQEAEERYSESRILGEKVLNVGDLNKETSATVLRVSIFVSRLMASLGFILRDVTSANLYPTYFRATGMALVTGFGRLGAMMGPLLYESIGELADFIVLLMLLSAVLLIFVPFVDLEPVAVGGEAGGSPVA